MEKKNMVLWFTDQKDTSYYVVELKFMERTKGDKIKHVQIGDEIFDDHPYGHLVIRAQGTIRHEESTPGDFQLYGAELEYRDMYSVRLQDAKIMAKTMQTLHRKLDTIYQKRGSCTTFTDFVVRVMDVTDVDTLVFTKKKGQGSWLDDDDYTFLTGKDAVYFLREKEVAWIPKREEVAA